MKESRMNIAAVIPHIHCTMELPQRLFLHSVAIYYDKAVGNPQIMGWSAETPTSFADAILKVGITHIALAQKEHREWLLQSAPDLESKVGVHVINLQGRKGPFKDTPSWLRSFWLDVKAFEINYLENKKTELALSKVDVAVDESTIIEMAYNGDLKGIQALVGMDDHTIQALLTRLRIIEASQSVRSITNQFHRMNRDQMPLTLFEADLVNDDKNLLKLGRKNWNSSSHHD
jgi:hypothetical protein